MKVRVAVVILAAVSTLGACQANDEKQSAGAVEPPTSSTSSAVPTTATTVAPSSTTSAPSTTVTTAKVTTTTRAKPATTTTTAPKLSNTQFFVSTGGCKNEIEYIRFDASSRAVAQTKAVVKGTSNVQLVTLGERDDRLLFSAFNCDTKTNALYDISLTDPKATPRLLASDLDFVDADYDIMTDAILVLTSSSADYAVLSIDPASHQRTVRWQRPAAWKAASLAPQRLRALTGGEMMIAAEGAGKFVVARVTRSGSTSGGLTGDGRLASFDLSILQERIALSFDRGEHDLYLCSFRAVYGAEGTAITATPDCIASDLPEALVGGNVRVAWGFGPGGGKTDAVLAVRGDAHILEVEKAEPPKILSTTRVEGLTAYYASSVYVVEKDLYPTLPSAAL